MDEWRALDHRAGLREHRSSTGRMYRCGGCGEIVSNVSAQHSCGYMPGLGWAA